MNEVRKQNIREAYKIISNELNGGSAQAEEIAEVLMDEFLRDHRTLQQNFGRTLYQFFKKVLPYTDRHDARNERTMMWVRQVAEIEAHFPFI